MENNFCLNAREDRSVRQRGDGVGGGGGGGGGERATKELTALEGARRF